MNSAPWLRHLSPSHLSQRKHLRSVGGLVKPVCKTRKAIQRNVTIKARSSFLSKEHDLLTQTCANQSSSTLQRPFLQGSLEMFPPPRISQNLRLCDIVKKKKKKRQVGRYIANIISENYQEFKRPRHMQNIYAALRLFKKL